ncbi:MAG: serine kinase [Cyanobacteria bacterium J06631_2]
MFSYYAYGLEIQSEIEIPEFVPSVNTAKCDIKITVDRTEKLSSYLSAEALEYPWALNITREKAIVYLKDLGLFSIKDGKTIVFIPAPQALEQAARFYIVGTVMAILLYQRGFLVLHGSVIEIDGEAVIFLGNSGDGKSTTAAALHAAGYKLVNDDVAPITLGDRPAFLEPGFPQIKMSPETAEALGYDFDSLPIIHPESVKRGYRPKNSFSRSPLNIKRIYVLDYGLKFASTPITASLATMELSRHSRPTTLYQQGDAQHFFQCANLVKEQTIYRLERPKSLELLPKIADFIKADLALECSKVS